MVTPVKNGSITYAIVFGTVIILSWICMRLRMISKSDFQIIRVITCVSGVATWLLWLCAWMHQWHPLIQPQWKAES